MLFSRRATLAAFIAISFAASARAQSVEFNRDVRPILSNHCFVCHGPDDNLRKAKLRLDVEKDAKADRGGYHVLLAGKPDQSELVRRILTKDAKEHMPPAKTGKQLTASEIDMLERWVKEGAKWQDHWSLIPPTRATPQAVDDKSWPINAIDHFVLARLEKEKLKPAPEGDRRTLLRRLHFDLIGLPPTPVQMDAFLADKSPKAYENAVDRLLASPHFGERLAIQWLDVVRYADTIGYHSDNHRDIAPYRDYVINAFNKNLPFDRFTIEQLAGDLLPNATIEQKIASGYNRLLQTTEEGGAQAKEYQAKYQADRVRNVSVAWMGLTIGCAECHNHKFDPVTAKDFYRFAAFFADIQEPAVGKQPQVKLPSPMQETRLKELDSQIADAQKLLQAPAIAKAQEQWEKEQREAKGKGLPKNVLDVLNLDVAKRNAKQKELLAVHYLGTRSDLQPQRDQLAKWQQQKNEITNAIPQTLITTTGKPRTVRVLPRGNWLDDSGEIVMPGVPVVFTSAAPKEKATRLDLANWLMSEHNPLTARVQVNRLWQLYFGQGLVKTPDDFGSMGAWPSHPELLDWLAVEFRASGWNIKHLVKLMVMSRTYRQSSQANDALRQRDPFNVLLARQARFRLDAELIRDNALAISGLLSPQVGGPSVKPYQPPGYWKHLNFPTREWQKDTGEKVYRRGLYNYWCRTFLHPELLAFDAPSREECTVQRPRSNTPQQALALLNDPIFVEAARVFAERIIRTAKSDEDRVQLAYREALNRSADAAEVKLLKGLFEQHLTQYRADAKAAEALVRVGDRAPAADLNTAELAAWTSVARVILNLHETITRN